MSATDDLTNRPGHDLTLGIDHHSRRQQCSPAGGSVISLSLKNQDPRQGHADRVPLGWTACLNRCPDRLTGALQGLRGKGRLTDADIDATTREIRLALLEADVSLPVVRDFVARIKERAKGAEVSGALNPARSSRSSTTN